MTSSPAELFQLNPLRLEAKKAAGFGKDVEVDACIAALPLGQAVGRKRVSIGSLPASADGKVQLMRQVSMT